MKQNFTTSQITRGLKGGYKLTLDLATLNDRDIELLNTDKLKTVEIKLHRNKRSLDANAALWKMLTEMAIELRTTKEELYERYLRQYGVSEIVGVSPNAIEDMKRLGGAKFYNDKGRTNVNGKEVVYLELIFGSSGYNTKEMSRLLDHVIEDAKDLGIDFISKEDRNIMMKNWGNE